MGVAASNWMHFFVNLQVDRPINGGNTSGGN